MPERSNPMKVTAHASSASLRQSQHRAATRWTNPLIMADIVRHFIFVAQLLFDGNQIFDVQHARKRVAAALATRLFARFTSVFVKACAQLSRALEDVKKFAERRIQERENHRDGVQNGDEIESVTAHPGV